MRRPLLVPLLAGLLAVGGLAVPPVAAAQTPTPAPAPAAARTLTLADDGATVTLQPGQRLDVRLEAQPGGAWQGVQGLETGTPTMHLLAFSSGQSQELTASLQALSAGRFGGSSQIRPQTLRAEVVFPCTVSDPACATVGRVWQVDVVVQDGPAEDSGLQCVRYPRPTPSPLPGGTFLDEGDDGRTVTVGRDGYVEVTLDGCEALSPAPPQAGAPLFRESVRVDRTVGQASARFRPQAGGSTAVTAAYDARCLHRTDASGDGECAVVQRAYSVTVQVGAASPGPTPTACTKPVYEGFSVSPHRVAAGDAVVVQGGRDDLCVDDAQEPLHDFRLLATRAGGQERELQAVRARTFRHEDRPDATTTYRLLMDGRSLRADGDRDTVVVDRVSGSCAGAVTLTGPRRAEAGDPVVLRGRAAPGQAVRVLFRRYGEDRFSVRRSLVAGPDGSFSATWLAADDHRWYAATDRCDSAPGLTQAVPVVLGPSVVRRGETVTLTVKAVRGVRTYLFFRGAGEAFSPRRVFTGPGTTTYVATSDQRYYPLTRAVRGTPRLTQVR